MQHDSSSDSQSAGSVGVDNIYSAQVMQSAHVKWTDCSLFETFWIIDALMIEAGSVQAARLSIWAKPIRFRVGPTGKPMSTLHI